MLARCWMLAALLPLAAAWMTYEPNCTLPTTNYNYVSSPNTRGTLDIIWSCFGVLTACVYSVLHLNIPRLKLSKDNEPSARPQQLDSFWSPVFWCSFVVIVPEWIYGLYLMEYWVVTRELNKLHRRVESTRSPHGWWKRATPRIFWKEEDFEKEKDCWTKVHFWFAQAGGLVVEGTEHNVVPKLWVPRVVHKKPRTNTGLGAIRDAMRGRTHTLPPGEDYELPRSDTAGTTGSGVMDLHEQPLTIHLTPLILRIALQEGLLDPTPIKTDDIVSLSKDDWFAKVLVTLQLISFTVTIFARLIERLPLTPLEVATVSFAICSAVVYLFMFSRPKNVSQTIALKTTQEHFDRIKQLVWVEDDWEIRRTHVEKCQNLYLPQDSRKLAQPKRSGGFMPTSSDQGIALIITMLFIGILVGSVHVAGWNLEFPSVWDMWLWRSAALATTCLPLVLACQILPWNFSYKPMSKMASWKTGPKEWRIFMTILSFMTGAVPVLGVYLIARGILLVETIRTLFYLPPDAYITTAWASGIPHFS